MSKLLVVDGNSIMNRAFYGIMGSKMLMTKDGKYTNAVYGFLAIIFKVIDDLNPDYIAVAFDLKAPTARHKMYEGYKANRKGMPNELAEQMPIIKDILRKMNITIIEKEGYEADDVLGTLAKRGEEQGVEVTILSGDRDTFQLATNKVTIRIPRTKVGKTEVDNFNRDKVVETYGVEPRDLIEVKGLMGDSSDNIPGVPGVGEKTALNLVKQYKTIDNLYKQIEAGTAEVKGKLKENLVNNKDLAELSRTLGTINVEVPIEESIEDLHVKEWNKEEVLNTFRELNFNRFIDRFSLRTAQNLEQTSKEEEKSKFVIKEIDLNNKEEISNVINTINNQGKMIYFFGKKQLKESKNIIKKQIYTLNVYNIETDEVYYIKAKNLLSSSVETNQNNLEVSLLNEFKQVFENEKIEKYGYSTNEDYVQLMENGIKISNIKYDAEIACYVLNPTNKVTMNSIAYEYLNFDVEDYVLNNKEENEVEEKSNKQINLFDQIQAENNVGENVEEVDSNKTKNALFAYCIGKLYEITIEKLKEINSIDLFNNIEMPLVEVLAQMQCNGMCVDKEELIELGNKLKANLERLTTEIHELAGEDFNINSTQQLGKILFEKLELPVIKKTKTGYSTDVDILEKLKDKHPIINKILEYRSLMKLNSTYVEGLLPCINENTGRIHSFFHQTITATGRISSTEPNLQNIPTRLELGKQVRKVFKPQEGYIYIDADYSQIELRVLAHISKDENMMHAFLNDEDIHKQAASKVLGIPIDEVTKEQRSSAKAVNFGIVYGISEFGLAEQLGITRKAAQEYINQYLEKYSGIKKFMSDIVEEAKSKGYVETLFHRRRYIPELSSNNYMVRQFGSRAAMNTPIQGTAADIMKIAMINVYKKLKENNIDAKIVLQVHDELILECNINQKDEASKILKENMENAIKLDVPLKVETCEALNWYEAK